MGEHGTGSRVNKQKDLKRENERLRARLMEAERALKMIREGDPKAPALSVGERSQEPYRIFVESMNEGAAMVGPVGTIVYCNERFAEMVKAPVKKLIGSPLQQFVFEDDFPSLEELQKSNKETVCRQGGDLRTSKGKRVPVCLSACTMKSGGARNICIIAMDRSRSKTFEEKLLESERQLRLIFDQIPAAVWTVDKDLRVRSASGSALAPAGVDAKDLVGKTSREFFGTEDLGTPPLSAHVAALRGEHRSYEYSLGDHVYSVDVQPLRDADGKIEGAIGVAVDVTESKKALEYAAKLAAIVNSSQDAIYGTTLSGRITSWNHSAELLYEYSAEEAVGQHVSITVPEDRNQEIEEILRKVRRDEVIKPFETVRRRKDGHLVDVSLTISGVKDAQNHTIGISAIAHDLRDRKEVEKELQKLSAQLLKAQDEARRKLARDLHDIVAQDLAAAAIELTALKQDEDLEPENRRKVVKALRITKKSVRGIRTFSYLLHPPLLDERGLLAALQWYVEGYNNRSRVHVELDLEKVQQGIGNEAELVLFRVVQEALTNVHRYSGSRHAVVYMRQRVHDLFLSISDDGHGMDAATLKKVQRGGAGLGVGIAGMKERVRQLGGQLRVTSGSSGTTVTVILPIKG